MQAVLIIIAFEAGAALAGAAVWLAMRSRDNNSAPEVTTDEPPAWLGPMCAALERIAAPPVVVPEPAREPVPEPEPTSWLEEVTARRIIVHTTDDKSIEGLLIDVFPADVALRSAKLLGNHPVELGGEISIPRAKILFVQMMPEASVTDIADRPVAFAIP